MTDQEIKDLQVKLSAEQEKNKALESEKVKLQESIEASKTANLKASIDNSIEKAVAEFKIVPAMRVSLTALAYKAAGLTEKTFKFTEGTQEKELDVSDVSVLITKMSEALPAQKITEPTSTEGEDKRKASEGEDKVVEGTKEFNTGKTMDEKIKKVMASQNLNYADAMDVVIEEEEVK